MRRDRLKMVSSSNSNSMVMGSKMQINNRTNSIWGSIKSTLWVLINKNKTVKWVIKTKFTTNNMLRWYTSNNNSSTWANTSIIILNRINSTTNMDRLIHTKCNKWISRWIRDPSSNSRCSSNKTQILSLTMARKVTTHHKMRRTCLSNFRCNNSLSPSSNTH